jgi:phosphatidylglycerophosphatase A
VAEVAPVRGAAVAFVMGAIVVGVELLAVSAVACMACPSAMPDTDAVGGVWDEVAGAVIVAMAGRLVNVR